jgi:phosphoenolpyruvate carboxykinase (GTP)
VISGVSPCWTVVAVTVAFGLQSIVRVARRDSAHRILWPGFGENSRVLRWVAERLNGSAEAIETPIGYVPTVDSLDTSGSQLTRDQLTDALAVDKDEWRAEIPRIEEWFSKIGAKLPIDLLKEIDSLTVRLTA